MVCINLKSSALPDRVIEQLQRVIAASARADRAFSIWQQLDKLKSETLRGVENLRALHSQVLRVGEYHIKIVAPDQDVPRVYYWKDEPLSSSPATMLPPSAPPVDPMNPWTPAIVHERRGAAGWTLVDTVALDAIRFGALLYRGPDITQAQTLWVTAVIDGPALEWTVSCHTFKPLHKTLAFGDAFPTPEQLWQELQQYRRIRLKGVKARHLLPGPLAIPAPRLDPDFHQDTKPVAAPAPTPPSDGFDWTCMMRLAQDLGWFIECQQGARLYLLANFSSQDNAPASVVQLIVHRRGKTDWHLTLLADCTVMEETDTSIAPLLGTPQDALDRIGVLMAEEAAESQVNAWLEAVETDWPRMRHEDGMLVLEGDAPDSDETPYTFASLELRIRPAQQTGRWRYDLFAKDVVFLDGLGPIPSYQCFLYASNVCRVPSWRLTLEATETAFVDSQTSGSFEASHLLATLGLQDAPPPPSVSDAMEQVADVDLGIDDAVDRALEAKGWWKPCLGVGCVTVDAERTLILTVDPREGTVSYEVRRDGHDLPEMDGDEDFRGVRHLPTPRDVMLTLGLSPSATTQVDVEVPLPAVSKTYHA